GRTAPGPPAEPHRRGTVPCSSRSGRYKPLALCEEPCLLPGTTVAVRPAGSTARPIGRVPGPFALAYRAGGGQANRGAALDTRATPAIGSRLGKAPASGAPAPRAPRPSLFSSGAVHDAHRLVVGRVSSAQPRSFLMLRSPPPCPRRPRAFTLIELLVVIAIIAILIG